MGDSGTRQTFRAPPWTGHPPMSVRYREPMAHSFVVAERAIGFRFRASLGRVLTRFHNSE